MSTTGVSYSAAPTAAQWQAMKHTITQIWLHQALNKKDLVHILRRDLGFMATERSCTTYLAKWRLSTYHTSQTSQPTRKRKHPLWMRDVSRQPVKRIAPNLLVHHLLPPDLYLQAEFLQYAIDRFVAGSFDDMVHQFKVVDLMRPSLKDGLTWESITDLYKTAELHLKTGNVQKCQKRLKQAHQEIRVVVLNGTPGKLRFLHSARGSSTKERLRQATRPLSTDTKQLQNRIFIIQFWRACHKLLRQDLRLLHQFSFVADFLLELESLLHHCLGKNHPLRELVYVVGQLPKVHMQNALELGTTRTLQVMAPGVAHRKRQSMIFPWWTDNIYGLEKRSSK